VSYYLWKDHAWTTLAADADMPAGFGTPATEVRILTGTQTGTYFVTAVDYVGHSEVNEKLLTLAERRWDMYHILSSTFWSLGIGLVVGIMGRLYFEVFLFGSSFSMLSKSARAAACPEGLGFIFVAGCVAFLLFFLCRGRQWSASLCASLHEARIRSSKVTLEDLKGAFKRLYDSYGRKTKG